MSIPNRFNFRAWDKKMNEWVDREFLVASEQSVGWEMQDYSERPMPSQDYILMQSTGLMDKNGTEMFEGDIVVKDGYYWFDEGMPNYRGTIEWVYCRWQVIAHCVNSGKTGISEGDNVGLNDDGCDVSDKSDWEVIGNIYKNKSLLNKEKAG